MQVFEGEQGVQVKRAALVVLLVLALFLAAKTFAEVSSFRYIGAGVPATNTITVDGSGEAFSIPDTAQFTFSVVEKQSTVAKAQEEATKKMDAILAYLKDQSIDEKDYKTIGYNVYPQYEWQNASCVNAATSYCPPGKQVLTGYEVRQTIEVKVRDTGKAGTLLSGVGERGATELSGLTFTVEDEDALKAEAREEAIKKAKTKADELAKQLGVTLVRVVSFTESGGGYPPVMYYDSYGRGGAEEVKSTAAAVPVPQGENKITSLVSVTYEIK